MPFTMYRINIKNISESSASRTQTVINAEKCRLVLTNECPLQLPMCWTWSKIPPHVQSLTTVILLDSIVSPFSTSSWICASIFSHVARLLHHLAMLRGWFVRVCLHLLTPWPPQSWVRALRLGLYQSGQLARLIQMQLHQLWLVLSGHKARPG